MPAVSVIIPAFNAASTIESALASVEAQTFRDFEIIVVDDGSSDGTAERAEHANTKARVIRQTNGGPGSARNAGIRHAQGRLVGFLDADDLWLPDKLARQVPYFDRFPQTGLLHAPIVVLPSAQPYLPPQTHEVFTPPQSRFCELFHIDIIVNTLTVLVPRKILMEVGGFDESREVHVEDWDLWLRIAASHPVGYQSQPAGLHRLGGLMSTAFEKTYAGQRVVIDKNRALCGTCDAHQRDPIACINRRLHALNGELGREYVQRGDIENARRAFAEALHYRPFDMSTRLRLVACALISRDALKRLHRMKHGAGDLRRRVTRGQHSEHVQLGDVSEINAPGAERQAVEELLRSPGADSRTVMTIHYPDVFKRNSAELIELLRTLGAAGLGYSVGVSPRKTPGAEVFEGLLIYAYPLNPTHARENLQ